MKRHRIVLFLLVPLLWACQTTGSPWRVVYNDLVLSTKDETVILPGADILSARLIEDSAAMNRYQIAIILNKEGTILFSRVTERAVGNVLLISAAGQRIMSPTIMAPIPDGRITVTGYQREEAQRVADALIKKQ